MCACVFFFQFIPMGNKNYKIKKKEQKQKAKAEKTNFKFFGLSGHFDTNKFESFFFLSYII